MIKINYDLVIIHNQKLSDNDGNCIDYKNEIMNDRLQCISSLV